MQQVAVFLAEEGEAVVFSVAVSLIRTPVLRSSRVGVERP